MTNKQLEDWLARISAMHPSEIELGLERISEVWAQLKPEGAIARRVVTYAGTNGKGSTLAMTERLLRDAGLHVCAYTSPHILRFTERLRVDGLESEAQAWVHAFERVETARAGTPLTYFEFTTLAALDIIASLQPDVALLEVGLGGRLDAVNIIDPDVAVITPIDLDHADWLGEDREAIGREKAGILRPGIPLVLSDPQPPESVLETARQLQCQVYALGRDHRILMEAGKPPVWTGSLEPAGGPVLHRTLDDMSTCVLPAENVSAAMQVGALLGVLPEDEGKSLAPWHHLPLRGRLERLSAAPEILVDVGHNPHAARYLHRWLCEHPVQGRTHAIFSALEDKDIESVVDAMRSVIDVWHVASLDVPRAAAIDRLEGAVSSRSGQTPRRHETVRQAVCQLLPQLDKTDRLLIFGSFYTVSEALPVLQKPGLAAWE
ncbi:folylpolyglutamate synthase/dihydrofolate synthase family protein [Hahella sp. SMD15-11]|uniref:Dihydrofolate synthase/folylpolyglutamate synthase n=1 Tax=Thermohahella caldifontis TaxID=3142973 RepID=A0AB39UYN9_9GAMM